MVDFDPIRFNQAMEVMETIVAEATVVVYAYYEGLIKRGFSEEQALTLTNTFQSIWWASMMRTMGDKG